MTAIDEEWSEEDLDRAEQQSFFHRWLRAGIIAGQSEDYDVEYFNWYWIFFNQPKGVNTDETRF